jgi:hypothetical protein
MPNDTLKTNQGSSFEAAIGAYVPPPAIDLRYTEKDNFRTAHSAADRYDILGYRVRWLDDDGKPLELGTRMHLVAGSLAVVTSRMNLASLPAWGGANCYWIDEAEPATRRYLMQGAGPGSYADPDGKFSVVSYAVVPFGFASLNEYLEVPGSRPGLRWIVEPSKRCFLGKLPRPIALQVLQSAQQAHP